MRFFAYFLLLCIGLILTACHDEEALTPSEEDLFPDRNETYLDDSLKMLFGPYNTVVEYRYVENYLPDNWYSITPVLKELVWPSMKFLKEMWVDVLIAGSSEEFVKAHFPRMLVLVGSPAYQKDGETEVLGEAEGGTLVRFTRMNDFNPYDLKWVDRQLSTAFHEYAHILHQTFNIPDAFREVTPNNYTLNGWLVVDTNECVAKGMLTPYATSSVSEDYAEMFAKYVLSSDAQWNFWYNEQALPLAGETDFAEKYERTLAMNAGRKYIQKKFAILKKSLKENGLDMDIVRQAAQNKLSTLK